MSKILKSQTSIILEELNVNMNLIFSCQTKSKAALEKTFREEEDFLPILKFIGIPR